MVRAVLAHRLAGCQRQAGLDVAQEVGALADQIVDRQEPEVRVVLAGRLVVRQW